MRGLSSGNKLFVKKLRKAKKEAPPGEKPAPVKTHLRNQVVLPEMIGSVVAIYNGKAFNQVEIKVRPAREHGSPSVGWDRQRCACSHWRISYADDVLEGAASRDGLWLCFSARILGDRCVRAWRCIT